MKTMLMALCLAAAPVLAQVGQQPGVTQPPTTAFAGGPITGAITGATGCTTPPFSFTGDTDSGLCASATNVVHVQTAPFASASSSILTLTNANTSLRFYDAASQLDFFSLADDVATIGTGGLTRVTVSTSQFTTTLGAGSSHTPLFSLNGNVANSTFLSFTNGANAIAFTYDTDDAIFVLSSTNAATENQTLTLDADSGHARLRNVSASAVSSEVVVSLANVRILADDAGGAASESRQNVRGFQFSYQATVASAATITPRSNVFHVTGTTNIDTITVAAAGTCYVLIFDGILTVGDLSGNINLSAAFVSTANDTLSLCHDGTNWHETARSVN